MNTADVIEYIYDKYNKAALFNMNDDEFESIIYQTCDELSWANEEFIYGTFGKHYELDINTEGVMKYIKKERSEYNATYKI